MEYLSVSEARRRSGLRLALSAGLPGPWGEAAKAVLLARNVEYVPVEQVPLQNNAELFEWTGIRNAPIAVYNDEPPVAGWIDILYLAERLGSGPSLLPDDYGERVLALGLTTEISSPGGLGWNRRLQIFSEVPPEVMKSAYGEMGPEIRAKLTYEYRVSMEAIAAAGTRVLQILNGLTEQLRRQRAGGSEYFVGQRLSVADLHWAAFSNLFVPLPHEVNPMTPTTRAVYGSINSAVKEAMSEELLTHRQMVWERHLKLPLDF